jgi:hypothetical protein
MVSSISPVLLSWTLLAQCLSAQVSSVDSVSGQPSNLISASLASSLGSISATVVTGVRNATTTSSSSSSSLLSSTTKDVTAIAGLSASSVRTSGAASVTTSARPKPSNTQPCNGYPEFCQRKFSNISMVVAHNSPFVKEHNAASNQLLPVLTQLKDGIRGRKSTTAQSSRTTNLIS